MRSQRVTGRLPDRAPDRLRGWAGKQHRACGLAWICWSGCGDGQLDAADACQQVAVEPHGVNRGRSVGAHVLHAKHERLDSATAGGIVEADAALDGYDSIRSLDVVYRLLADLVVVVHFAFIVFVAVGAFMAWRWPWLVWLHVPSVIYSALIITVGFQCFLTPLEVHFRERAGEEGYSGGFVDRYIEDVSTPGSTRPRSGLSSRSRSSSGTWAST